MKYKVEYQLKKLLFELCWTSLYTSLQTVEATGVSFQKFISNESYPHFRTGL